MKLIIAALCLSAALAAVTIDVGHKNSASGSTCDLVITFTGAAADEVWNSGSTTASQASQGLASLLEGSATAAWDGASGSTTLNFLADYTGDSTDGSTLASATGAFGITVYNASAANGDGAAHDTVTSGFGTVTLATDPAASATVVAFDVAGFSPADIFVAAGYSDLTASSDSTEDDTAARNLEEEAVTTATHQGWYTVADSGLTLITNQDQSGAAASTVTATTTFTPLTNAAADDAARNLEEEETDTGCSALNVYLSSASFSKEMTVAGLAAAAGVAAFF